jgi:tetratricopeptide (TPR) repeat protein
MIRNRPLLTVGAIALLLACLWSPAAVAVNPAEGQICDARADYFLAAENYPEAIRLHREVLRKYPQSALAHYHLGFAEGMVGDRTQELDEIDAPLRSDSSAGTCTSTRASRCSRMAALRRPQMRCGLRFGLAPAGQNLITISA